MKINFNRYIINEYSVDVVPTCVNNRKLKTFYQRNRKNKSISYMNKINVMRNIIKGSYK